MLTPQEVSGHAFTKAVMGGYNMAMVDEFLDELTDDYTALYKENAALKAKMKVLVEKVEDYRATEDSMRATLLTAQKMADSIVREAEGKRDQMLKSAERQAQDKINSLRKEAEEARERLRVGQQELTAFVEKVNLVFAKEQQLLSELPGMPVSVEEPQTQTPPESEIEGKILDSYRQAQEPTAAETRASQQTTKPLPQLGRSEQPAAPAQQPQSAPQPAPRPAPPAQQQPAAEEKPAPAPEPPQETAPYPEGNPFVPMDDEPTRKMNLDELKFGRNYNRVE